MTQWYLEAGGFHDSGVVETEAGFESFTRRMAAFAIAVAVLSEVNIVNRFVAGCAITRSHTQIEHATYLGGWRVLRRALELGCSGTCGDSRCYVSTRPMEQATKRIIDLHVHCHLRTHSLDVTVPRHMIAPLLH